MPAEHPFELPKRHKACTRSTGANWLRQRAAFNHAAKTIMPISLFNFVGGSTCTERLVRVDFSDDGFVVALAQSSTPVAEVDCEGLLLLPGFIDVQTNGGFNIDFSSAVLLPGDVERVLADIVRFGVTSLVPTLISSSRDVYAHTLDRVFLPLWRSTRDRARGARFLGMHLEGPFLAAARKGAHAPQHFRSCRTEGLTPAHAAACMPATFGASVAYLATSAAPAAACNSAGLGAVDGGDNGFVRMLTLAPEVDGALDLIQHLSARGVVCSLGHTCATYDVCETALGFGAASLTHLFNAMPALSHRGDPGPIALLGRRGAAPYFGLIADGAHVHPAVAALAFRAAPSRCVLITDAMPALGAPVRSGGAAISYGSLPVTLHAGAAAGDGIYPGVHAVVAGTSTLAGAVAPLDACLRNLVRALGSGEGEGGGVEGGGEAEGALPLSTLRAAAAAVTANPARMLRLEGVLGALTPGAHADAVLLHPRTAAVVAVFVGGALMWHDDTEAGRRIAAQAQLQVATDSAPRAGAAAPSASPDRASSLIAEG